MYLVPILYAERIMRKAEMEEAKVKIAGRTLNNLRYADHTSLMAVQKTDKKVEERKRKGRPIST